MPPQKGLDCFIGYFGMFFRSPFILDLRSPCYTFSFDLRPASPNHSPCLPPSRSTSSTLQPIRSRFCPSDTALLRYDDVRPVTGSTEFVFYNSSLDSLTARRLPVLPPHLRINNLRLTSSKVRQPCPPLSSLFDCDLCAL